MTNGTTLPYWKGPLAVVVFFKARSNTSIPAGSWSSSSSSGLFFPSSVMTLSSGLPGFTAFSFIELEYGSLSISSSETSSVPINAFLISAKLIQSKLPPELATMRKVKSIVLDAPGFKTPGNVPSNSLAETIVQLGSPPSYFNPAGK